MKKLKHKIGDVVDGRKARWFDCGWDNKTDGCTVCKVCKYLDWKDWAESVGKPPGSSIEYNQEMEEYLKLEDTETKKKFIKKI